MNACSNSELHKKEKSLNAIASNIQEMFKSRKGGKQKINVTVYVQKKYDNV